MTVSAAPALAGPFDGNDAATSFPFDFKIFADSDLRVVLRDALTAEYLLTLDVDYSVSMNPDQNADPGGTITYPLSGSPLATGERLTVTTDLELSQQTVFTNLGKFFPATVEDTFDRLTMLLRQIQAESVRAVRLPLSLADSDPALPTPVAGAALVWNETGTALVNGVPTESLVALGGDPDGASLVSYTPAGTGAVATTVRAKLREFVSVSDYSSAAAAVGNITTSGLIHVPNGGTTTPISADGKNILWEYDQGGDSDNVIDADGNRGGFFADYDCKAGKVLVYQVREDQSAIAGGGFRDLLFLNTVDNDTTNYTAVGQKCTYGVRSYVQGAYVSGAYQSQYKDLVGGEFYAIGNIQWDDRGCSGITAAAVQYGSGIASNEFSVQNPASGAAGGVEQSLSMAAIQPIIRAQFADEDATHLVRGVLVTNVGRRATAGVELLSSTTEGYSGHYKRAIEMGQAVVTDAAIYMPQSASGSVGTIIVYDPNDYSVFDRENNRFGWVVGGVQNLTVSENGVGVGLTIASTAQTRLQINSSTSALSHLQLMAGSTPSAPNNGEIWFDGSALKIVIGGVVRTVTVT